jgi:hypothetical protein
MKDRTYELSISQKNKIYDTVLNMNSLSSKANELDGNNVYNMNLHCNRSNEFKW